MLVLRLAPWQIDALRKGETVPGRVGAEGGLATEVLRIEPPAPRASAPHVRRAQASFLRQSMAETLRQAAGQRNPLTESGPQAAENGVQGQESVSEEHVPPTVAEGRVPQGPRQVMAAGGSLDARLDAYARKLDATDADVAARIQRLTAASGTTMAAASAGIRQALGQSEPAPQHAGWAISHAPRPVARDGDHANTLHLHVRVGPYVLGSLTRLAERLQVDLPDVLEEVLVVGCDALDQGL